MTLRSGDTLPNTLPEFLPDALRDSQRIRATDANRRKGYGLGLLARILSACDHELQEIFVPLWHGPATDLYDHAANARARKVAAAVVGNNPAWCKLERRHDGMLHLHILTRADAWPLLPSGATRRPVYDAEGLVRYLSKPADARACLVRRKDPVTGQTLTSEAPDSAGLLDAYQDYMQARALAGGRRFPRLSWSHQLPRMTGLRAEVGSA